MLQSIIRSRNIEPFSRCFGIYRKLCTAGDLELADEENELKTRFDIDRWREKKIYRKNFIENLFLGIFENRALEYPEIRTLEEVNYLQTHRNEIDNLISNNIDNKAIESPGKISKDVLQLLKENDLLGMKLKNKNQGLGYFELETNFIKESLALNPSIYKFVTEIENVGREIINSFTNEDQKSEYVSKCLNGKFIVSLAHMENANPESLDPLSLSTTAVKVPGKKFTISGRKTLVYNPSSADTLIVSATTNANADNVDKSYSLFMVDKNAEGVSILEPMKTIGMRNLEVCEVVFDNVSVPESSIVGKLNEGSVIIKKFSKRSSSNGPQCIALGKKALNELVKYCIFKSHFKKPLYKHKYVQGKIGEMVLALYSAESMMYFLSGRLDECEDLNATLESAIVKVYTSEALNFILQNYINFVGREEMFNNEFTRDLIRDSYFFSAFDEPNGQLKLLLATAGVKHAMSQLKNKTEKDFKPKNFLELFFFKRQRQKYVKTDEDSFGFLHLALEEESKRLEYIVRYLQVLTQIMIGNYGDKVLDQTHELLQLSDIVIDIYRMTAALGRASRSYCIGLRYADIEITTARNVTQSGYQRCLATINNLEQQWRKNEKYKNIERGDFNSFDFIRKQPPECLIKRR